MHHEKNRGEGFCRNLGGKCYPSVLYPSVLWRCWLGGRKGIWPVKTEWLCAGVVICLERGADLHMAQLMPLPLTVSCSSKIQIGFTFLVPAHPGSPGERAVKRVCVVASSHMNSYYELMPLKTFFCKSFPLQAFFFFFSERTTWFPRLLLLLLTYLLLLFSFTIFSCHLLAVD